VPLPIACRWGAAQFRFLDVLLRPPGNRDARGARSRFRYRHQPRAPPGRKPRLPPVRTRFRTGEFGTRGRAAPKPFPVGGFGPDRWPRRVSGCRVQRGHPTARPLLFPATNRSAATARSLSPLNSHLPSPSPSSAGSAMPRGVPDRLAGEVGDAALEGLGVEEGAWVSCRWSRRTGARRPRWRPGRSSAAAGRPDRARSACVRAESRATRRLAGPGGRPRRPAPRRARAWQAAGCFRSGRPSRRP
jgi:hypothetical protein